MTAAEFRRFSKRYAEILYTNIESAAKLYFPEGVNYLDLCCGPGLMSERMTRVGYTPHLLDAHEGFLKTARNLCPKSQVTLCNVLEAPKLPQYTNVLFTNASAYFSLDELHTIFAKLPGARRVIANFMVHEDQKLVREIPDILMQRRGRRWVYTMGCDELLVLDALRERDLQAFLKEHRFHVDACFFYYDFKVERLLLLSR